MILGLHTDNAIMVGRRLDRQESKKNKILYLKTNNVMDAHEGYIVIPFTYMTISVAQC